MSTAVADAVRRLRAAGFTVEQISRTVSLPIIEVKAVLS